MNTTKTPTETPTAAQWHLRIVGAWPALKDKAHCDQRLNAFLTNLFALNCGKIDSSPSPLRLASYEYTAKDPAIPCTRNLYINLGLTETETEAGHTLDSAAERFCRVMLNPSAGDVIRMLTPMGIMGVSLVSNPFNWSWTRECYRECLTRGSTLVKMISRDADDSFLPDWAFMVCFVVVSDLDFGVFADRALPPVNVLGSIDPQNVQVASKVLEKYCKMSYAYELRDWTQRHQHFKDAIQKVLIQLEATIDPWDPSPAQTYTSLCTTLHTATVSLAKLLVFRHIVFTNFLTRCTDAANTKMNVIHSKDTKTPPEHSSTVTSMVARLSTQPPHTPPPPRTPIITTTGTALTTSILCVIAFILALSVGNPILKFVAMVGLIAVVYFSPKKKSTSKTSEEYCRAMSEWRKMGAGLGYPNDMYEIIAQSWGVAYDALVLQRLLKRSQGGTVEFVDAIASSWWEKFTTVIRKPEEGPALGDDLEPRAVVAFIGARVEEVRGVYGKKVEKMW